MNNINSLNCVKNIYYGKKSETNCLLTSTYNGFRKTGSQKKDSNYWSGRFKCLNKNCTVLKTNIRNEPQITDDVIINFCVVKKKINHNSLEIKQKLNGQERENLALKAIAEESDVLRSNIILKRSETNQSIRGDFIHENILTKIMGAGCFVACNIS
ncbi:hypothetical protein BpHYR1_035505 [Brachionus plicatilis]|uniref:Uncharacterized protein n=1 Tax=Brachionus plicatilis TaxID=10195 RepID=A0A3M7SPG1_BRAPC|nr:hypothetical protein BpHYR1_035505 [Brachionus plicatilis]